MIISFWKICFGKIHTSSSPLCFFFSKTILPQNFPSWWIWHAGSPPCLWESCRLISCHPSGLCLCSPSRSRRSPSAPAASAAGRCAVSWWRGPPGRAPSSRAFWESWGLCSASCSRGSYIRRVSTDTKNIQISIKVWYLYIYYIYNTTQTIPVSV